MNFSFAMCLSLFMSELEIDLISHPSSLIKANGIIITFKMPRSTKLYELFQICHRKLCLGFYFSFFFFVDNNSNTSRWPKRFGCFIKAKLWGPLIIIDVHIHCKICNNDNLTIMGFQLLGIKFSTDNETETRNVRQSLNYLVRSQE